LTGIVRKSAPLQTVLLSLKETNKDYFREILYPIFLDLHYKII